MTDAPGDAQAYFIKMPAGIEMEAGFDIQGFKAGNRGKGGLLNACHAGITGFLFAVA